MPALLSYLSSAAISFGSILLIAAASLRLLNVASNRESKEKLSQRIREFWVETSELAGPEKMHRSLEARYARMKSLRWSFLKLFWFFCFVVVLASVPSSWNLPHEKRIESLQQDVDLDFSLGYAVRCNVHFSGSGKKPQEIAKICDAKNRENGPDELAVYMQREKKFKSLVQQMSHRSALASSLAMTTIAIAILAVPLSLALFISFNFTLWVLRRITRSKLHYSVLILLDFFVALAAPPMITSFSLLLLFGLEVIALRQVVDLSIFDSANWLTLAIGSAALHVNGSFIIPIVAIALGYWLTGFIGVTILIATYIIAPIWLGILRIGEFAAAVLKIMNLDFSNDILESVIDWAIFTDVLFSLFYLLPSLLLVLANRSNRTREAFLNVVMYVGDHKEGPYAAMADLLTTIGDIPKKLFGGRRDE